jgi:hypothetical protein
MNPELRRLLWLEVTPQRLWLIPLALIGGALVMERTLPFALPSLALVAFLALTLLWGAHQAANAVLGEARARTWDVQRMSALSAWSMTWGKLVGATLMPWYGGAICLALYFVYRPAFGLDESFTWATHVILVALGTQALALTGALITVHRQRHVRTGMNIVLVLALLGLLLPAFGSLLVPAGDTVGVLGGAVNWYTRRWAGNAFTLMLLGLVAAWAILGAYRSMRSELQIRGTPWAWLGGIVFAGTIVSGFTPATNPLTVVTNWCAHTALVACVASYVAGFAYARDPIQYRRVAQALRERRFRRSLEDLPLWSSSACLALLLALTASILESTSAPRSGFGTTLGATALALTLLMLRNLALLNWLSLRSRTQRAEVTTLVYLALLDHILPGLLRIVGLPAIAGLLELPLFDRPWAAVGIAVLHAGVAIGLAVAAYRAARPILSSPGDRRS